MILDIITGWFFAESSAYGEMLFNLRKLMLEKDSIFVKIL